jgi:phage terminase small subunit
MTTYAMETRLTPKQQLFVSAVLKGKTINEAYKAAGFKPHASNGSRYSAIDKIQKAIRSAQRKAAEQQHVTTVSLAADLEEIRMLAIEDKQYAAAVAAVLGRAKLLGLIVDRKEVEVLHRPAPLPTKTIELSEEEWRKQFAEVPDLAQKAADAGEAAGAVALDVGISQADLETAGLSGAKGKTKVGLKVGIGKRAPKKA